MGPGRLGALYLAALAVPLAEGLLDLELALGPCAALALLPWLLLAPAPRRPDAAPGGALTPALLALPPLALGAGVDLARGAAGGTLALAAGTTWLALVLWTAAAERAPRARPAAAWYASVWFLLVPFGLALRVALSWVPARGGAEPGRPAWLALDPLLFLHRWGRAEGLAELRPAECAWVLLGAGLALLAARAPAGRGVEAT
ncbi:MAG TPA: hypothetical protein VF530_23800 [Planctomycetota bacterium]